MAKAVTYINDLRLMVQHLRAVTSVPAAIVGMDRTPAPPVELAKSQTSESRLSFPVAMERFADLPSVQSVSNAAQVNEKFPFSGECAPSELIFVDQSAEEANEPASYEWEAVTAGISTAADAPAATVGDQVVSAMERTRQSSVPLDFLKESRGHVAVLPEPSCPVPLRDAPLQGNIQDWIEMCKQNKLAVECKSQLCSRRLQRSLMKLFPDRKAPENGLTVVSVSQRTVHNMAGWSGDVAQERETALAGFMSIAYLVCGKLRAAGHWSDFIDPSSGRAYYGVYSNETFYETDERMRHLGYSIEDLGCCKALAHPLWGTNVFAGIIVTDANPDSPVLQEILRLPQDDRS